MIANRAPVRAGVVLGLAGSLLALSCAGRLEGGESRYRIDHAELGCATDIFQQRCTSQYCHDSEDPTGGLDLQSLGYRDRLIGIPASDPRCAGRLLVDPSAPEKSFLLEKISTDVPQCGDRMPLSGEPLSDTEMACLRTWVSTLLGLDGATSVNPGDAGAPGPDARAGHDAASPPPQDASSRDAAPSRDSGSTGKADGDSTTPVDAATPPVDANGGAG